MNKELKIFLIQLKKDWKQELTKQYKIFPITKNGKRRIIAQPIGELKNKLNEVYKGIFSKYIFFKIISCSKKRGLVHHVRPHVNKKYVITLDISNCFPSTRFTLVKASLKKAYGLSSAESNLLASLVTRKNRLPQGSITSTFICNLCLENLLKEVTLNAEQIGVSITVYVDDIAISGPVNESLKIFNEIVSILRENRYRTKKIKKYFREDIQLINGIVVNKKPLPSEEFLQELESIYSELKTNLPVIDYMQLLKLKGKVSFCKYISKDLGLEWEKRLNIFSSYLS